MNIFKLIHTAIAGSVNAVAAAGSAEVHKYLGPAGVTYLSSKIKKALVLKLDASAIVQNAATAATDKVPSAAVAKVLQDQITEQNTNIYQALTLSSTAYFGPTGAQYIIYNGRRCYLHLCFEILKTIEANSVICKLPFEVSEIYNIGHLTSKGTVYGISVAGDSVICLQSLANGERLVIDLTLVVKHSP